MTCEAARKEAAVVVGRKLALDALKECAIKQVTIAHLIRRAMG